MFATLSLFTLPLSASAQLTIALTDIELQPDLAGQVFLIELENVGDPVFLQGVHLELFVADGGPQFGQAIIGPAIRDVSVTSPGALFAENNTNDRGFGNYAGEIGAPPGGYDQMFQRDTSTASETITLGTGTFTLAQVEFDTTGGVSPGRYSWTAVLSPAGPSSLFYPPDTIAPTLTLTDGTLTVVPEPALLTLATAFGLLVVGLGRGFVRPLSE